MAKLTPEILEHLDECMKKKKMTLPPPPPSNLPLRVEVEGNRGEGGKREWDVFGGEGVKEIFEAIDNAVEKASDEVQTPAAEKLMAEKPEVFKNLAEGKPVEVDLQTEKRAMHGAVLRMALLRMAMRGASAREAAKVIGCHYNTAKTYYSDPAFKRAVFQRVEEAFGELDSASASRARSLHALIEEQALKSFEDLVGMLQSPDLAAAHRIKINQDFLNRCEESQQMSKHTTSLDATTLMRAGETAKEMEAAAQGKLVQLPLREEKLG